MLSYLNKRKIPILGRDLPIIRQQTGNALGQNLGGHFGLKNGVYYLHNLHNVHFVNYVNGEELINILLKLEQSEEKEDILNKLKELL